MIYEVVEEISIFLDVANFCTFKNETLSSRKLGKKTCVFENLSKLFPKIIEFWKKYQNSKIKLTIELVSEPFFKKKVSLPINF